MQNNENRVQGMTESQHQAHAAKLARRARIAAAAAAVQPPEEKTRGYAPSVRLPSLPFLETPKEWADRQRLIPLPKRKDPIQPNFEVIAEIAPEIKIVGVDLIQRVVGNYFDIERIEILGASRAGEVVLARHIAMYLAKKLTGRSLPDIGRRFGRRDHTTVLHAVRKIKQSMSEDIAFAAEVDHLEELIRGDA